MSIRFGGCRVESAAVWAQRPQPTDIFDGKEQNDFNVLLYVATKHTFENSFGWG